MLSHKRCHSERGKLWEIGKKRPKNPFAKQNHALLGVAPPLPTGSRLWREDPSIFCVPFPPCRSRLRMTRRGIAVVNKNTPNGDRRSGCKFLTCTVPPEFFTLYSIGGRGERRYRSPLFRKKLSACGFSLWGVPWEGRVFSSALVRAQDFARLYSEWGLTISLQSRSPLSSAVITTSAVAMLVATGML